MQRTVSFFAFLGAQRIYYTIFFRYCKWFLKKFVKKSNIFALFCRQKLCGCEFSRKREGKERDKHLRDTRCEKQDLRTAEGITDKGDASRFAVKPREEIRENGTDHHADENREVGKNRMEREIIRAIRFGQMNVRQGREDRARCHAEDMLREANDDVKPEGVCRDERIHKESCRVEQHDDGQRAEPIELGDELFPHRREEDEEKEIGGVDAVAKRVAHADVLQNVSVQGCVGKVCGKRICRRDENGEQKFLFLKGQGKDIGKLCARGGGVREFLRDKKDKAVNSGERIRDKTNDRQHQKLVLSACHLIADGGNDERDEKREKAIDTARRVEIVDAHVFGQEVCMPR